MGWFYLYTEEDDIYEMAITSSVKVSAKSNVSSAKTEDKQVVADNAVAYNREISYNGIITNIGILGGKEGALSSPTDYLEGVEALRRDRKIVTCFLDKDLQSIPNCIITNLSYEKTPEEGVSSWKIDLQLQEIRLSSAAAEAVVPSPKKEVSDTTASKSDSGNAATEAKAINEVPIDIGGLLGG